MLVRHRCTLVASRIRSTIRFAWSTATLTAAVALQGCEGGVLSPAGEISRAQRLILEDSLTIMLVIVIPTLAAALVFAFWFRASNTRAVYRPNWAYSGRLELLVWSIPILVILFLSGVIWTGSHDLDPYRPIPSQHRPLEVQVVSLDWKWLFIYPDHGIATVNQLVVPAGMPIHFSLTSASVMNAFFVPQLGSLIYTMNHMVTQLHLQADRPGSFYGQSAQLSGDGFSDMNFTVRAVTPEAFASWVSTSREEAGPPLDRAAYLTLSRPSLMGPFTYGTVDPSLFHAIVTQELPPGPGPVNAEHPTGQANRQQASRQQVSVDRPQGAN